MRPLPLREGSVFRIAGDADDADGAALRLQQQRAIDHIAIGPQPLRERLVDDGDVGFARDLAGVKGAAAHDGESDGVEVALGGEIEGHIVHGRGCSNPAALTETAGVDESIGARFDIAAATTPGHGRGAIERLARQARQHLR